MYKSKTLSLYDQIEEIENGRENQNDNTASHASHASHASRRDLSLCNDSHNLWDAYGTEGVPQASHDPMAYHASKVESIASLYPAGCMAWLRDHSPELYRSIDAAEEQIDSAEGNDFRSAVDRWAELWMQGIKEYKQHISNDIKEITQNEF